jgi:hypothetical protein
MVSVVGRAALWVGVETGRLGDGEASVAPSDDVTEGLGAEDAGATAQEVRPNAPNTTKAAQPARNEITPATYPTSSDSLASAEHCTATQGCASQLIENVTSPLGRTLGRVETGRRARFAPPGP